MPRIIFFIYGTICYLFFFVTFLYSVGFVTNFAVPVSIDGSVNKSLAEALLINLGLLGLFAVQHSVMARQGFKEKWVKIIPAPIERSSYVLASTICLASLMYYWQPMGGIIWQVDNELGRAALTSLGLTGWATVLVSTFLINHFDLFGLRQVWLYLINRPYTVLEFRTPFFYKYVRHPLYLGFVMAFWFTPTMTVAHLLFAIMTTGYILVAIQLEEKDLVDFHGEDYKEYQKSTPMIFPGVGRPGRKNPEVELEGNKN